MSKSYLDGFHEASKRWFESHFNEPTLAQTQGWPAISTGKNVLISAPTGSGKTLTAFFWSIDQLMFKEDIPDKSNRLEVIYISPLKALAFDIEKNLQQPLVGVSQVAEELGAEYSIPVVASRTGDTSAYDRTKMIKNPPNLLITTPESFYLMLTSRMSENFAGVKTVIIDEIHSLAPNKRGAHLSLSLERLEEITDEPFQRIGLSATQKPLSVVSNYLGGSLDDKPRKVLVVDTEIKKRIDLEVRVEIDHLGSLAEPLMDSLEPSDESPTSVSVWHSIHEKLLKLISEHDSTIVFVNSRRLAERTAARLNQLYYDDLNLASEGIVSSTKEGQEVVLSHHGSLSQTKRRIVEAELKSGTLKALVATSSLELGIDMGKVDLVVQISSPGSVSSGLQRVGRASHQVGAVSVGKFFPTHRIDLIETIVVSQRMLSGEIELISIIDNPLDVLAQQIVAMLSVEEWHFDDLKKAIRRSNNFSNLQDDVFVNVLNLLSGYYPSDDFYELRPRIVWDKKTNLLKARSGSQLLAVTSGGTIPDRGLFGVFLRDGKRVGELDEEMVYESRVGEIFMLGTSTWRIEEISYDRVIVSPAPGQVGRTPFWHGDTIGREFAIGNAMGQLLEEYISKDLDQDFLNNQLNEKAVENFCSFIQEQQDDSITPTNKSIVIEKFQDEFGNWKVCILSMFGARVNAPWGMAISKVLNEQTDLEYEIQWNNDGIIIWFLDGSYPNFSAQLIAIHPEEIENILIEELPNTAMFAARFRECAARALLLPKPKPGKRAPLWQQRYKSQALLKSVLNYPDFPILLETTRECFQDIFDLPSLKSLLQQINISEIKLIEKNLDQPSVFSQSILFGWLDEYMYTPDQPLAERRNAIVQLDQDLLESILGKDFSVDILDVEVVDQYNQDLQRLSPSWQAHNEDQVEDLLRWLGPLETTEITARSDIEILDSTLENLLSTNRLVEIQFKNKKLLAASSDIPLLNKVYELEIETLLDEYPKNKSDSITDLVSRHARTNVSFSLQDLIKNLFIEETAAIKSINELESAGKIRLVKFAKNQPEKWCDTQIFRAIRERSLNKVRKAIEPVASEVFASFLIDWQFVGSNLRGPEGLEEVLNVLEDSVLSLSLIESIIFPSRVKDYDPSFLDSLLASGQLNWIGVSKAGNNDGKVKFFWSDSKTELVDIDNVQLELSAAQKCILETLKIKGALFWQDIAIEIKDSGHDYSTTSLDKALWDLVWKGLVSNDSFVGLRNFLKKNIAPTSSSNQKRRRRLTSASYSSNNKLGRWKLAKTKSKNNDDTVFLYDLSNQLLNRYGVLTPEVAAKEELNGGFSLIYPVLKQMELSGVVRRGYFIDSLGATQFSLPGVIDRLRSFKGSNDSNMVLLSAVDPAQPYGSILPWPGTSFRLSRSVGAYVVIFEGKLICYLDKTHKKLVLFEGADKSDLWAMTLCSLVDDDLIPKIELDQIIQDTFPDSTIKSILESYGFVDGYKGLTYRK